MTNNIKILKFFGSYCAPCSALKPIVQQVALETGIEVIPYNLDEQEGKFTEFNVRSIPTLIFLKNNLEVGRKVGMLTKDALLKTIEELK